MQRNGGDRPLGFGLQPVVPFQEPWIAMRDCRGALPVMGKGLRQALVPQPVGHLFDQQRYRQGPTERVERQQGLQRLQVLGSPALESLPADRQRQLLHVDAVRAFHGKGVGGAAEIFQAWPIIGLDGACRMRFPIDPRYVA